MIEDDQFNRSHARKTDPETSHAAAESAQGIAADHCRTILHTLGWNSRPLAVEQLEALCGLTKWQISRRMSDLKKAGKIEESEERHRNQNGRSAIKWKIVARPLREELRLTSETA